MIWFLVIIFCFYSILIFSLAIGFTKIDEFKSENKKSKTTFSVVIPFRNEAKNLTNLLESISKIEYPKNLVEFIFVDDNSTDDSIEIIEAFISDQIERIKNLKPFDYIIIKNIRNSNSPKKDAISAAINIAKNEWILTTDADCVLHKSWLHTFDNFIQKNTPKMVVAPVNYKAENNSLEQFQLLDFMSLQGTTIGAFGINFPFLCNGANLAYKKEDFLKLNGFEGNTNIASGDDIFLFQKFIKADKKSVQYLKSKEVIVTTFPVKTNSDLINQRIRWATKTTSYDSWLVKCIGIIVFLTNLSVILSIFLSDNLTLIFLPFLLKLIIDLFLFIPTARFFNHQKSFFKWYLFSSIMYPVFSIFIVLKSIFFKYSWKDRSFKK